MAKTSFSPVTPQSSAEHGMKTEKRDLAAPPPSTPLLSLLRPTLDLYAKPDEQAALIQSDICEAAI